MTEFRLTCDVATILRRAGLMFWHTENERKCTPQQGVQRVRMGVLAGVPDFIIATPSVERWPAVAIELKVPGKRLSNRQRTVRDELMKCGWNYCVIYTADEALDLVRKLWPGRV